VALLGEVDAVRRAAVLAGRERVDPAREVVPEEVKTVIGARVSRAGVEGAADDGPAETRTGRDARSAIEARDAHHRVRGQRRIDRGAGRRTVAGGRSGGLIIGLRPETLVARPAVVAAARVQHVDLLGLHPADVGDEDLSRVSRRGTGAAGAGTDRDAERIAE